VGGGVEFRRERGRLVEAGGEDVQVDRGLEQDLPVLPGQDAGALVSVGVEALQGLERHRGTLGHRQRGPGRPGFMSGPHRVFGVRRRSRGGVAHHRATAPRVLDGEGPVPARPFVARDEQRGADRGVALYCHFLPLRLSGLSVTTKLDQVRAAANGRPPRIKAKEPFDFF
jgi:hypothetical protein